MMPFSNYIAVIVKGDVRFNSLNGALVDTSRLRRF